MSYTCTYGFKRCLLGGAGACGCPRDSGSGAQAMRPEGAQPVGPQSGGEQPHRPNSVKAG
jgi:hypothetical protein